MTTGIRYIRSVVLLVVLAAGAGLGCSPVVLPDLPNSTDLGSPRGYRMTRVITHFHSPFSYDACDGNPFPNGVLNETCYNDLVSAMCHNRIDTLFLTDHPDTMANYDMTTLVHAGTKDTVLTSADGPYGKKVGSCSNGFQPVITIGFESSQLMAMGMTQHLDTDIATRLSLYQTRTAAVSTQLKTQAKALVVIPHTEGWTASDIQMIQPDAIEILNIHPIVDPRIRANLLGSQPFLDVGSFLTFLVDPFGTTVPDFGFLFFLRLYPVYMQMWDTLVYGGLKVTGVGGTDSHQNIFNQVMSDGERLDAHRRLTRIFSNHYLVKTTDFTDLKTAIRAGRGWLVMEGLGSPVNMDFYATVGSTVTGVGETGSLGGASATIHVQVPTLSSASPQGSESPVIYVELRYVNGSGTDIVVASSIGESIDYKTTTAGAYRVHVMMTPKHLNKYLKDFPGLANGELMVNQQYPWVITNHLYLQ